MESLVIIFLCSLLVLTQVFWMFHTQSLVNKIMSGNYAEYAQSKSILKKKSKRPSKQTELPLDAREDLRYMGFN